MRKETQNKRKKKERDWERKEWSCLIETDLISALATDLHSFPHLLTYGAVKWYELIAVPKLTLTLIVYCAPNRVHEPSIAYSSPQYDLKLRSCLAYLFNGRQSLHLRSQPLF